MDTQTRLALKKKDKFAQATASSMTWVSGHRSSVTRWVIVGVVLIALVAAGLTFYMMRSNAADAALGSALDIYVAPLAAAGAPPEPGTYATAGERSKAANQQFVAVTKQYSWLPQGAHAHYFAGVTDQDLGQTASAETELKAAADSWDRNLANLAKLALAGIYHQTSRDPQAIDLYNGLIAKPSETVSANVARLDLADLYAAESKQADARKLWAAVKDADKDGAAGSIATQKLTPKQ